MANLTIPCQCCGKQTPIQWMWFVCDSCGYRICASCLGKHYGPYNPNGGIKCSQCMNGYLRQQNHI
ncbi:MAG: hypothetical protein KBT03_10070 [Bacteroidales bacterium]|nr:hypothetical protein [Candidatus Scybalousia scybalohippi]MCQ2326759.1 hypothetical protein [Bacteroidales bacterium]